MTATARLPLEKVLGEAVRLPWRRRGAFAGALALPAAVIIVVHGTGWHFSGRLDGTSQGLLWAAESILWVIFTVTCHRLVLLDPAPAGARFALRWGLRETIFALLMVMVMVLGVAAAYPVILVAGNVVQWMTPSRGQVSPLLELMTQWTLPLVMLCVAARLATVFPAVAIDRRPDLGRAWRQTRGNGWRMLVIVGALPYLLNGLVYAMEREDATLVDGVALTVLALAFLVVEVAAVSVAYRELSALEPPAQPA